MQNGAIWHKRVRTKSEFVADLVQAQNSLNPFLSLFCFFLSTLTSPLHIPPPTATLDPPPTFVFDMLRNTVSSIAKRAYSSQPVISVSKVTSPAAWKKLGSPNSFTSWPKPTNACHAQTNSPPFLSPVHSSFQLVSPLMVLLALWATLPW